MAGSSSNGVIRVGRKGIKQFAFGDDGPPFAVDVVVAFHHWLAIDESLRPDEPDADGNRPIATADIPAYHQAARGFVEELGGGKVTTAEALDFIARLREQYDELADFFRPRSRQKQESQDTSEAELRFSEETAN